LGPTPVARGGPEADRHCGGRAEPDGVAPQDGREDMIGPCDALPNAGALWKAHVETGEPLTGNEVAIVVAAGLAEAEDWEDRGGGLHWHAPRWPDVGTVG
jgi:hypothetical protein